MESGKSLFSAIDNIKADMTDVSYSRVFSPPYFEESDELEYLVKSSLEEVSGQIRYLDIFHPILVVESEIYLASDDRPSSVPWARVIRKDYRRDHKWFDIVKLDHVEEYLDNITRYYDDEIIKRIGVRACKSITDANGYLVSQHREQL
jgi:hypothetical protein